METLNPFETSLPATSPQHVAIIFLTNVVEDPKPRESNCCSVCFKLQNFREK